MITFYVTCIIYRNFPLERVPSIYQDQVVAEVVAAGFPEKVGAYPVETPVEDPEINDQPLEDAE